MYVPSVVVSTVCVCVYPRLFLSPGRKVAPGCGWSRLPLRCHRQRDISRRCRNQQRGGQSGRLTSECSETTPTWICRYNPGQATAHPYACSRPHPDLLRPVAVRWVVASRAGPQPRSLPIYLPRLCVSPLLLSFHPLEKCSPPPSFPLFSRPRAPFSPLPPHNRHAFASDTTDTTLPPLLSEIATSLCVLSAPTRILLPFAPYRPCAFRFPPPRSTLTPYL